MEEVKKKSKTVFMKTHNESGIPSGYELSNFIFDKKITQFPCKVSVRYKVGKRRKVAKMRIVSYDSHRCELCGRHTYIDIFIHGKSEFRET
jgi:hypothetical protein